MGLRRFAGRLVEAVVALAAPLGLPGVASTAGRTGTRLGRYQLVTAPSVADRTNLAYLARAPDG